MGARGVLESERRHAEETGALRVNLKNAEAKLAAAKGEYQRGMIAGVLWTIVGFVLYRVTQSFWIEVWWHARAFWP